MSHPDGVSRLPVPTTTPPARVQRTKPAAFARPSISITNEGKRTWQQLLASEVRPGDVIPNVGQVMRVQEVIDPITYDWTVTLTNVAEVEFRFGGNDLVQVFSNHKVVENP